MRKLSLLPIWMLLTWLLTHNQMRGQEMNVDSLFTVWADTSQNKEARVEAYYARFSVIQNEFANPESQRWIVGVKTALALATDIGKTEYLSRFQIVLASFEYMTSEGTTHSCSFSQQALNTALENQDYHSALVSSFLLVFANCEAVEGRERNETVIGQIPAIMDSLEHRVDNPAIHKAANLLTGDFYFARYDYAEALKCYQKAFQVLDTASFQKSEYISLEFMGLILMETGNFAEAEPYLRTGLNMSKSRHNQRETGVFYSTLAEAALNQGNSQEARSLLDSAAFFMQGSEECYPCLMRTRRIRAGIDNLLGNHQAALDQLLELRNFYTTSTRPTSSSVQRYFVELGKAYLGLKQPRQALDAARKGLTKNDFDLYPKSENLAVMYQAWQAMGNYRQAFAHYQTYISLRDSLSHLRNGQEVTRIELAYQFQQERLADSLAVAQQKLEQEITFQTELNRQKTNRNILIGLGIVALLVAIGLFARLRHIRHTKELLEEKNQQIQAEKEKVLASERAKQQFLANMSHEIRTPMNAIKGMTDILLRRDPKPEQTGHLSAIKESSNSLLVIINDILDLSKIEAGKIDLEEIPFSIADVIENVETIMQFKAEEKGLLLQRKVPNYLPAQVLGDPTRLHQILLNLVGNAIKFTEKGVVSIEVSAQLTAESDQMDVRFCVSDTGVGIGKDRLEKIFESFEQAYSDTTRKFGGTGLGLSISKKLVEIQDGEIWAESEKGKGSQFYVTLSFPIVQGLVETQSNESSIAALAAQLKSIRILLVEDNTFNAIVAQEELEDAIEQVGVEVAENGAIAVEKMKMGSYDIILMDVQMPVMNGYEATQKIRALAPEKAKIPIIAMTANVMKEEVDRCYEAGMDDFIGKPFEVNTLLTKIHGLL